MKRLLFVLLFLVIAHPASGASIGAGTDGRYDIRFQDAGLKEALQFLATIAKLNIMIPEEVEGVVSVSFRSIPIGDAINSIVKANGLDYTVEAGVIRIGNQDVFADTGENLRTATFRLNYATANDMVDQVKSLLSSRGTVLADDRTNSLVVRELPGNIDNVRLFVNEVDVRDAQVLIEAKILEATRSFSRALGIQWGITSSGNKLDLEGLSAVGAADSARDLQFNSPAGNPTSGLALVIGSFTGSTNIDIQLSAAEERGDVYIISDPSVVTSNGMPARIRSGTTLLVNSQGDINIGSTSSTGVQGGGAGLQQIETGVELRVTPQISVNQYIKLMISAVTSQPDFTRTVNGVPSIIDNTAETTVLVRDGETTVIGGLTKFSDTVSERRVPGLSRIPLLGNLFKSKNKVKENTELMVLVKPSIVRTEGTTPVQMRVHELEKRRMLMDLKPLVDPDKELEKRRKRELGSQNQRSKGNKYVR